MHYRSYEEVEDGLEDSYAPALNMIYRTPFPVSAALLLLPEVPGVELKDGMFFLSKTLLGPNYAN